jgi:hypothetical protein
VQQQTANTMPAAEMQRLARIGATIALADDLKRHLAMDAMFPGILKDARKQVRMNGHAAEPAKPKRFLSAAARRKISLAQKRRWAKQRKLAKAG